MSTVVHIWDPDEDSGSSLKLSFGHAAIEFGGHYASIWPIEKWRDQIVTSHSTDCWLMGDKKFNRQPSSSIRIRNMAEDQMAAFWRESKKKIKYDTALLNCSTLSARILVEGIPRHRFDSFSTVLKAYRPKNFLLLLGLSPVAGLDLVLNAMASAIRGDGDKISIRSPKVLKQMALVLKDLNEN